MVDPLLINGQDILPLLTCNVRRKPGNLERCCSACLSDSVWVLRLSHTFPPPLSKVRWITPQTALFDIPERCKMTIDEIFHFSDPGSSTDWWHVSGSRFLFWMDATTEIPKTSKSAVSTTFTLYPSIGLIKIKDGRRESSETIRQYLPLCFPLSSQSC